MSRERLFAAAAVGLCAALGIYACGEGTTDPPPPPPPPDPPRATTVTVTPATAELAALEATAQFTAEVRDQRGQSMAGAAVAWSSSDPTVATVDNAGLVTAAGNGTVTITATSGSASGNATVTVDQAVGAVSVSPAADTLVAAGDTLRLAAEAADANGHAVSGAEFSWASGDTLVATVDAAGLVTAGSAGQVEITATSSGIEGRAALTVMHSVGSVVVSPAEGTIAPGDTLRLVAEALDANGDRIADASFAWLSSDVSVTTVDASGLVAGVGEGAATMTAMAGSVQGTARITVANPDRAALVALYEATDGPNWVNSENWLTDAPLDDWYGVDTDAAGRVTRLQLHGRRVEDGGYVRHGLTGPIPPALGRLGNLTILDLSLNRLTGPIPPELGDLAHLTSLNLLENRLTGAVPVELGNLTDLEGLGLGNNQFTGPIPPEFGGLTQLSALRLFNNGFDGPLPSELGNLLRLRNLDVSGNRLEGPVPPAIGGLDELVNLRLRRNQLTGKVPAEFGQLTSLEILTLDGNPGLAGPLPVTLAGLTSLRVLRFEDSGLCAPGTSTFREWLRGVDTVSGDSCAGFDVAVLTSLYHATNGTGWHESGGWLGDGALEEWHGVTADSLGRVVALDLSRNGLTGKLPPALGDLDQLIDLRIGGNGLTGGLPLSLARLSLQVFRYADTELCVPAHESYRAWLNAIPSLEGTGVQCPLPPDREILEALYEATDGPNWRQDMNWLGDAPLRDWYGVEVDEDGGVVGLRLGGNNLRGPIPPELGELASLLTLDLSRNTLIGSMPLELGYLVKLRTLDLSENYLRSPIPPELGNLAELRTLELDHNELTSLIPPELGNLANLRTLMLQGSSNRGVPRLEGPIPVEFGNLANLTRLYLSNNDLTGSIPPELGNLANLTRLYLNNNDLTGSIPPELGKLANLTRLSLVTNGLTGPIPAEIANLSRLERLELKHNDLAGPIPSGLGNLAGLVKLDLGANQLTGSIPAELGNLSNAEFLLLEDNDLSGSVPPSFSGLRSLRWLYFANNAALAGPLPTSLTALRQLDELLAGETDLCAPSDPAFAVWLEGVRKRWIAPCLEGDAPAAYLVQAVQSREFPVPLVAGRKALLRVFVTASRATSAGIPRVRARFYINGRETHVADIPGKAAPLPTEVTESDLSKSVNTEIPGDVIQPGLEMVMEVDPDRTLDPDLGVAERIPEEGTLSVEVRAVPNFRLTILPFLWRTAPDSAVLAITRAMAADPENHELLEPMFTLLPVGDLRVMLHEPVLTSTNRGSHLDRETVAIRAIEGGTGHWLSTMTGQVLGTGHGAGGSNRVSFKRIDGPGAIGNGIAHSFGHDMSLQHPPPSPSYTGRVATHVTDFAYPHANESIGGWGYDFRGGGSLVAPSRPDVMGSTNPTAWISDYHFTNALRFRLVDEAPPTAGTAVATKSLLLWGGTDADGVPFLEPSFVVEVPAALPDSAGEHRLTGRTVDGRELFSLSFGMTEPAHGDGETSFVFVLPVRPGWESDLATITLDGPGGSQRSTARARCPWRFCAIPSPDRCAPSCATRRLRSRRTAR